MKICMVGDFSETLDEGYTNTSHSLAHGLDGVRGAEYGTRNSVTRLDAKQARTPAFWRTFAGSQPQIIHTIAQPTGQSLALTHLLRRSRPGVRTVVSALRVERYFAGGAASRKQRLLLRMTRPDLVLVQSPAAQAQFQALGCQAELLPNGVDLTRFRPASPQHKRQLRERYGVDLDRPVVLHVGHLHEAHNLQALAPLVAQGVQVVVATGSPHMGAPPDLTGRLAAAGFHLFKGYQPRIEELYMLADCYVFPRPPGDSMTMPLSVLEAMATNLPVVTTRCSGLEQAFAPGGGFVFRDRADEMSSAAEALLGSPYPYRTREMVRRFSWQAVTERLETYYERLMAA